MHLVMWRQILILCLEADAYFLLGHKKAHPDYHQLSSFTVHLHQAVYRPPCPFVHLVKYWELTGQCRRSATPVRIVTYNLWKGSNRTRRHRGAVLTSQAHMHSTYCLSWHSSWVAITPPACIKPAKLRHLLGAGAGGTGGGQHWHSSSQSCFLFFKSWSL